MINIISKKQEPRKRVICSNCGSELEYGNADLYSEEFKSDGVYHSRVVYYFYCPVCRCKEVADWITQGTNVENTHSQDFDSVGDFHNGFARVKLNDKCNFISTEGKMLTQQWFDWAGSFFEGFAVVKLNDKYNFINTECKYLSQHWFDSAGGFDEGYSMVELNNKLYYLNTKGQLCDYDTKEVLKSIIKMKE